MDADANRRSALEAAEKMMETRRQLRQLLGDGYAVRVQPYVVAIRGAMTETRSALAVAHAMASAAMDLDAGPVRIGLIISAALDIIDADGDRARGNSGP